MQQSVTGTTRRWLAVMGIEGVLVAAGAGCIAVIIALPWQFHVWALADDAAFGPDVEVTTQLRTFQLALLLATTFAFAYATAAWIVRELRAEMAMIQEAALQVAEGQFDTPVPSCALLTDIASAVELSRQRVAERNRRQEERLEELTRQACDADAAPSIGEKIDTSELLPVEIRVAGRTATGGLVEVSQRQAVVRVAEGGGVDLARGMTALVVLRSPQDNARIDVPALTTARSDADGTATYTFSFNEPDRLRGMAPSLAAIFDNRRDFRVTPDHRGVIEASVVVAGAHSPLPAKVLDVSASGAGVLLRADPGTLSAWGTRVILRMKLPGGADPLVIAARIRNIGADAGGTRVGLSFEATDPGTFAHIQRVVGAYVLARHRETRLTGLTMVM